MNLGFIPFFTLANLVLLYIFTNIVIIEQNPSITPLTKGGRI
ncbi:hypothetical protein bcere0010_8950 [Bacillus cereus ATCC 4342]|nr:hypothetical protein bcere0010_8950 [Bacillus cereus ATCC 4342]